MPGTARITSDDSSSAKQTPNQRYVASQKLKGLEPCSVWIPREHKSQLQIIANACCENTDLEPFLPRSISTGKIVKL